MSQTRSTVAPTANLADTAAAFARWRSRTLLGSRIPEELRSQAVELAGTRGVAKVAARLRLDYDRLKRRVEGEVQVGAPKPPAFVEMTLDLPPSGPECVLALADPRGRSLRVEWTRAVASEVAAVAGSLWEASA